MFNPFHPPGPQDRPRRDPAYQAHKAAVEGALIQHLTDSNRVIQDIVDDYRTIVSVPIQDCASTEKKAGTAPTQDP